MSSAARVIVGSWVDTRPTAYDYLGMSVDVTWPRTELNDRVRANIEVWMTRRRMTGARLAELLGVSAAWVSYRINGRQEIGLYDVEAIAQALDVDPIELITERQPVPVAPRPSRTPATSRRTSRRGARNIGPSSHALTRLATVAHTTTDRPPSGHPRSAIHNQDGAVHRSAGPRTARGLWRHG